MSKERIACCVEQHFYCRSGSSKDQRRPSRLPTATAAHGVIQCQIPCVMLQLHICNLTLKVKKTSRAECTSILNDSINPQVCRKTPSQMLVPPSRSPCICLNQTCQRSNRASVSVGSGGPEFCFRLHMALNIAVFLAICTGFSINVTIKEVGVLMGPFKQPSSIFWLFHLLYSASSDGLSGFASLQLDCLATRPSAGALSNSECVRLPCPGLIILAVQPLSWLSAFLLHPLVNIQLGTMAKTTEVISPRIELGLAKIKYEQRVRVPRSCVWVGVNNRSHFTSIPPLVNADQSRLLSQFVMFPFMFYKAHMTGSWIWTVLTQQVLKGRVFLFIFKGKWLETELQDWTIMLMWV